MRLRAHRSEGKMAQMVYADSALESVLCGGALGNRHHLDCELGTVRSWGRMHITGTLKIKEND